MNTLCSIGEKMKGKKIHCITNPVSMNDVANLILALGGSPIMAQASQEVAEVTAICDVTLLNTGVPEDDKWNALRIAGEKANQLGHRVILDPVGVGCSRYRCQNMKKLLETVTPDVIRCNQEEAKVLLSYEISHSGGVDSSVTVSVEEAQRMALEIAKRYHTISYITGTKDVVSDGSKCVMIQGGTPKMKKITGSGCMLSALIALFCSADEDLYSSVVLAGSQWRKCAMRAEQQSEAGIGTFHQMLFNVLEKDAILE